MVSNGRIGLTLEGDALPMLIQCHGIEFFALVIGAIGDAPVVQIDGAGLLLHLKARNAGIDRAHGGHQLLAAGVAIGQHLEGERTPVI